VLVDNGKCGAGKVLQLTGVEGLLILPQTDTEDASRSLITGRLRSSGIRKRVGRLTIRARAGLLSMASP